MTSFNLYAFRKTAACPEVRRQRLPLERLDGAIRWTVGLGCDTVLLELDERAPSCTAFVTHHVCSDPACPGGC